MFSSCFSEQLWVEGFVLLVQASKGCAILLIASGLLRANLSLPKPHMRKPHYSTLPNSLFCFVGLFVLYLFGVYGFVCFFKVGFLLLFWGDFCLVWPCFVLVFSAFPISPVSKSWLASFTVPLNCRVYKEQRKSYFLSITSALSGDHHAKTQDPQSWCSFSQASSRAGRWPGAASDHSKTR